MNFKARYKREFRSIFSFLPCVDKEIIEIGSIHLFKHRNNLNSLRGETFYKLPAYESHTRKNSFLRRNLLKKKQSDTFELNLDVESSTLNGKSRFNKNLNTE